MAIRTSKLYRNRRCGMKLEALENRQLLAGITDDGVETESDVLHDPSGNTLDLVRLTGSDIIGHGG